MNADREIRIRKLPPELSAWMESEWRKDPRRSYTEIALDALQGLACERVSDAKRLLRTLEVVEGHGVPSSPRGAGR